MEVEAAVVGRPQTALWSMKCALMLSSIQSLLHVPMALLSLVADYCEPQIVVFGSEDSRFVWKRTIGGKDWTQLERMPSAQVYPTAAVVGDSLYIAVGLDSPYVHRYSILFNSWSWTSTTGFPPMYSPRTGAATLSVGNRMLSFGGLEMGTTLGTCFAFDPTTNYWVSLRPMSSPRYLACAAEWQGHAFVFGGHGGPRSELSSAAEYDPVMDLWRDIPPMNVPRIQATAVAVPGRGLLVMGGYRNIITECSAELYDPRTATWTIMPWQLPKPLFGFAAHCIHGILYILGGANLSKHSECFCMDLDAAVPVWLPLPPLPTDLAVMLSVLLP